MPFKYTVGLNLNVIVMSLLLSASVRMSMHRVGWMFSLWVTGQVEGG